MSRFSDWVAKHGISKDTQRGIVKGAAIGGSFLIPGGPLAAAGLGAAGGYLSGGGVKGALIGGATNYGLGKLAGGLGSGAAEAAIPGSTPAVGAALPAASSGAATGVAGAATAAAPAVASGGGGGLAGIGSWVTRNPMATAMLAGTAADIYSGYKQGSIADEDRRRELEAQRSLQPGMSDVMSRIRSFQPQPAMQPLPMRY